MQKNDTVIQFSGLKSGKYSYHYTLDDEFFSRFENDEITKSSVDFQVNLEKTERTMLFSFTFEGIVTTSCDRCLDPLDVSVSGSQTLCVNISDSEQTDEEDVVILPENAFKIDLAQWMYEYVVIAMPMQKVHAENECNQEMLKYLKNEDGHQSSDFDPRWDELLKLKNKQ